ncbi:hypothetical protein E3E12_06275 [Formicincola oecophyllae]|uniref:Uncharacterized protein n=1 Tax=Formicincola oecophyllae TaxID=2558361 RepID=A0A4Y6UBA5_9PROT|nr:hypothetical protein [Formicincola oecophyllae]QDH13858.1 hypothetical protein E3E12_06275 [Formicincola oecophyllae]
MMRHRFSAPTRLLGTALLGAVFTLPTLQGEAEAQEVEFGAPVDATANQHAGAPGNATGNKRGGGEHIHARGHRAPPKGYQEAPSVEFENGPDPDHLAKQEHDKITGTDLTQFGTAYTSHNPIQQGNLGDATGNGWVAPRGNGW